MSHEYAWVVDGNVGICEYRRMSEWVSEWVSEWMSEWTNERTNEWMNELAHLCQHAKTSHRFQSCQWCRAGNTTHRGGCNEGPVKPVYIQRQVFGQNTHKQCTMNSFSKEWWEKSWSKNLISFLKTLAFLHRTPTNAAAPFTKKKGKTSGSSHTVEGESNCRVYSREFPLLKPFKLCVWPSYTAQLRGRQRHCDLPGCEVSPKKQVSNSTKPYEILWNPNWFNRDPYNGLL